MADEPKLTPQAEQLVEAARKLFDETLLAGGIKEKTTRHIYFGAAATSLEDILRKNPEYATKIKPEFAKDMLITASDQIQSGSAVDMKALESMAKVEARKPLLLTEGTKPAVTPEKKTPASSPPSSGAEKPAAEAGEKAAPETKYKFGSIGKLIATNPKAAPAVAAGGTVLAACLWPSKKVEVTKDDGTTETQKKWGFGKKAVVAVGVIISGAMLAHHIPGPTKGWMAKLAKEATTKAPAAGLGT